MLGEHVALRRVIKSIASKVRGADIVDRDLVFSNIEVDAKESRKYNSKYFHN